MWPLWDEIWLRCQRSATLTPLQVGIHCDFRFPGSFSLLLQLRVPTQARTQPLLFSCISHRSLPVTSEFWAQWKCRLYKHFKSRQVISIGTKGFKRNSAKNCSKLAISSEVGHQGPRREEAGWINAYPRFPWLLYFSESCYQLLRAPPPAHSTNLLSYPEIQGTRGEDEVQLG